jgi:hypothetical protein
MTFEYSNLNDRSPGWFFRLARRVLPGVGLIEGEIRPYAETWAERNLAALPWSGPLCGQCWATRCRRASARARLSTGGSRRRSVPWQAEASATGSSTCRSAARVSDVRSRQIPAVAGLSTAPELVTVLVGGNDIIRRDLRARLPENYRALLSALPAGALVATVPRTRGVQAEVNRIVHQSADAGAVVAVPLTLAAGARAADHFHPDDTGYAAIAAGFTTAILARRRRSQTDATHKAYVR